MNKQQDGIDFLPYLVMPTNFTNASTTIHKRSRSSSATRVRAGSKTRCSSRSRSTSRSRSSSQRSSSTTRSRQRSNSATRSLSTTTNRNTNNSNKRRESMGLIQRRRSYKTTSSSNIDTSATTSTNESIIKYCNIHTSVKIRSGKCPICTAGEIKRRKSLDNNSEVALDKLKRRNSNGSLKTESDDIPPPTVDKLEVNNDNKTKDIDVNVDTNIDQAITEEEAVLDEKCVNVLRSITVANEQKAKDKSIIEDSTQEVATDHDIQIDTPKETDETEDVKQLPPSNKTKVQSKTATTNQALTELQQIISRATMSIGKFTVNKKDEVDDEKIDTDDNKEDNAAQDDDDDNSFSSFTMNESSIGIKTFAESKDEQLPPHPTSKQTPPQQDGLDALDTISKPTGKEEVANTNSSHASSSSDSSVTLSVSTLESYNSLAAPPSILNKLKKSHALTPNMHNSPTSVLDTKILYSEQVREAESEEGEGGGDLGSSFYMHEPKSYSEKKVTAQIIEDDKSNITSAVDKPNKGEEIIVEDVIMDSSDEEETPINIIPPDVKSQLPCQIDQPSKDEEGEVAVVKDSNDDTNNEEPPSLGSKISPTPPPIKPRRPSFFSSLVQNVRSRSISRSRRRSKSRSTSRARRESSRSTSRTRSDLKVADTLNEKQNEVNTVSSPPVDSSFGTGSRSDAKPQQSSSSPKPIEPQPVIDNTIQRGPISHPSYQLGDAGRDEDMIIFPKSKKRQSRSRRRRRRSKKDDGDTSNSDSDDDEDHSSRSPACQVNISLAIGQLRHLDAAFVRRSKGGWSYAIVANSNHDEIRFVVNSTGSTKSIPIEQWKSCIRRVKVLTPREGHRIPEPSPQKRSLGRSSFRQRGKTKGRFVSPSPTRRSAGVINIPSTIMEGSSYT